jgi:hypothetical protein
MLTIWTYFYRCSKISCIKNSCDNGKLQPRYTAMKNGGNLKQIFPEKEYRGLSPKFHIHVSVSELYIPTMGLSLSWRKYVDRSWEYINRSHSQTHECRNWGWGRAIPRKGICKRNCRCYVGQQKQLQLQELYRRNLENRISTTEVKAKAAATWADTEHLKQQELSKSSYNRSGKRVAETKAASYLVAATKAVAAAVETTVLTTAAAAAPPVQQ